MWCLSFPLRLPWQSFPWSYGNASFLGLGKSILLNIAQTWTWNIEREMSAWQIVLLLQEEDSISTLIYLQLSIFRGCYWSFSYILCFQLCLWEPFIFVTCFTSAIFSRVPKTLQLPQVKDKELRSVVNKDSSQYIFPLLFAVSAAFKFSFESTLIADPGGLWTLQERDLCQFCIPNPWRDKAFIKNILEEVDNKGLFLFLPNFMISRKNLQGVCRH